MFLSKSASIQQILLCSIQKFKSVPKDLLQYLHLQYSVHLGNESETAGICEISMLSVK